MPECSICIETYNKTKRAKVTCRCDYSACRLCIKTYLLDQTEDAHCMNCKVIWNRKFMVDNFEKCFISKNYRDHREKILFDREMSMLQATQPYVEREIKLENLNNSIIELQMNYFNKMRELKDEYESISSNTTVERKKFIRKCPSNECHGFLSSSLKCALCENFACANCHEISGKTTENREAHICNPQIVESVKFLEKDSKPCPTCASITFKIVGCDSMWCVECHTSWNWVSGKIETGIIHNPEYFDWLKKQHGSIPRNPLDIVCGREIDNHFIQRLLVIFRNVKCILPSSNNFDEIARNIIHIRHVEIPRFNRNNQLEDNLKLRIDYMRDKITKDDFKKTIQKKEKINEKNREITNVLRMYVNCITDIFYRLLDDPDKKNIIKLEMDELRKYVNDSLSTIAITFNSKKYYINENYIFS